MIDNLSGRSKNFHLQSKKMYLLQWLTKVFKYLTIENSSGPYALHETFQILLALSRNMTIL